MIQAEHITKTFNGFMALDDMSLHVPKGTIYGLVGPNGAGKSTLIRHLTGIYRPDSGSILIDGLPVYDNPEAKAKFTYIPDDMFYFLQSNTLEMKQFYQGIYKKFDAALFDRLQEFFPNIDTKRSIRRLSKGMQKQVAFWLSICAMPELMILDEPTSYLDIRHKLELLAILRKMAKENGITVIMSLHEIDLAQKISDQVICVKGDRIAEFGDPEEIFTEATIRDLYEIDNGYYDPIFGSVELPKPEGEPEVLVLSSGKTGIPVYRKLQKAGIPFAAGILYPGESDYQLARLLASGIISEEPYEPISDETYQKALKIMEKCGKVINAGVKVGSMNQKMGELLRIAEERRMLVSI